MRTIAGAMCGHGGGGGKTLNRRIPRIDFPSPPRFRCPVEDDRWRDVWSLNTRSLQNINRKAFANDHRGESCQKNNSFQDSSAEYAEAGKGRRAQPRISRMARIGIETAKLTSQVRHDSGASAVSLKNFMLIVRNRCDRFHVIRRFSTV